MESLVAENVDLSSSDQSGLTPMERIYGMHKGVDLDNLMNTYLETAAKHIASCIHCSLFPWLRPAFPSVAAGIPSVGCWLAKCG